MLETWIIHKLQLASMFTGGMCRGGDYCRRICCQRGTQDSMNPCHHGCICHRTVRDAAWSPWRHRRGRTAQACSFAVCPSHCTTPRAAPHRLAIAPLLCCALRQREGAPPGHHVAPPRASPTHRADDPPFEG